MRMTLRWTFFRSAGPEGEGGGFDSPSLPPLDTLPSPKRPGDVPLDPNAEGRSGRLAEKALYCASDVLRIAFSGRHPPCAPIVYARPSGAPAQRSQRNQRNHDSTVPPGKHDFNEINDFNGFTVPPEKHEINDFNEITIPRPPNGITKTTKPTKPTKCLFCGHFVFFVVYGEIVISLQPLPPTQKSPSGVGRGCRLTCFCTSLRNTSGSCRW